MKPYLLLDPEKQCPSDCCINLLDCEVLSNWEILFDCKILSNWEVCIMITVYEAQR